MRGRARRRRPRRAFVGRRACARIASNSAAGSPPSLRDARDARDRTCPQTIERATVARSRRVARRSKADAGARAPSKDACEATVVRTRAIERQDVARRAPSSRRAARRARGARGRVARARVVARRARRAQASTAWRRRRCAADVLPAARGREAEDAERGACTWRRWRPKRNASRADPAATRRVGSPPSREGARPRASYRGCEEVDARDAATAEDRSGDARSRVA